MKGMGCTMNKSDYTGAFDRIRPTPTFKQRTVVAMQQALTEPRQPHRIPVKALSIAALAACMVLVTVAVLKEAGSLPIGGGIGIASTQEKMGGLVSTDEIISINIRKSGGMAYSYAQEVAAVQDAKSIKLVTDYFNSLTLTKLADNADKPDGQMYMVAIAYSDGGNKSYTLVAEKYLLGEDGAWYEIPDEQAAAFGTVLASIPQYSSIDTSLINSMNGVSMTAEKGTYPTDVQEIKLSIVNGSKQALTFGEPYTLEQQKNGRWYTVPDQGELFFNALAQLLNAGEKADVAAQIGSFPLITGTPFEAGNYRILKQVSSDEGQTWLSAEFTVVGTAGAPIGISNIDPSLINNLDGLSMKTKQPTYPTDTKSIQLSIINYSKQNLNYGAAYTIERKQGNEWYIVPNTDVAFIEIAYLLDVGKTAEASAPLPTTPLQAGTYRILKQFSSDEGQAWLSAEFTITADDAASVPAVTVTSTAVAYSSDSPAKAPDVIPVAPTSATTATPPAAGKSLTMTTDKSSYPIGTASINATLVNDSNDTLYYSPDYSMSKLTDGKWVDIRSSVLLDIAKFGALMSKEQKTIPLSLGRFLGLTAPNRYRFNLTVSKDENMCDTFIVCTEFDLT